MTNYLEMDSNEPLEMVQLLVPCGSLMPAQPLNANGFADYRWQKYDGTFKMVERKTWGEFLANPDKVEEQLLRHLTKQPQVELVFMLEGVVMQGSVSTHTLKPTKSGVWIKNKFSSGTRLSRVYSMLYRFSQFMQVVQTTSIIESGIMLTSMYNSDQKENHETFNRNIKLVTFAPDPRVATLMGASNGLGDRRATDIIAAVGTPWNFFSAGWCEHSVFKTWKELTKLPGIGETTIKNALKHIGRPDV